MGWKDGLKAVLKPAGGPAVVLDAPGDHCVTGKVLANVISGVLHKQSVRTGTVHPSTEWTVADFVESGSGLQQASAGLVGIWWGDRGQDVFYIGTVFDFFL